MQVRTVNLIWERRVRGAYPVAPFALDNDGALSLAVPRPLEVRAYDLTRLHRDGAMETRGTFSVETLQELEVSAQADSLLGLTTDDCYLFRPTGSGHDKVRYLGERRVNFIDAGLSEDGRAIAAGFSDMAGASFALSFGTMGGEERWLRDVEAPLTALAMARDGGRVAWGAETGTLWLTDAAMRDLWRFEQEAGAIRALACSHNADAVAYSTVFGVVGLIDASGARLWETNLSAETLSLALSGDGALCAALCRGAEGGTRIVLLTGQGQIGWEFAAAAPLLRLALSPNGRWLATSTRNGGLTLYEIILSEEVAVVPNGDPIADAFARSNVLFEYGDKEGGYRVLKEALIANPAECGQGDFAWSVGHIWEDILDARYKQVRKYREAGDYMGALDILRRLLAVEPHEPRTCALLEEVIEERVNQLLAEARRLIEKRDRRSAEATLRDAIALDPFFEDGRRELSALLKGRASDADAEAERLLGAGDLAGGVAALERAQSVTPTPDRAARLERARTALEFAEGMAAYNDRRYQEALFQFKKVLARDPQHNEARRYLGFAERFAQDASADSLTDRFSRLE